METHNWKLVRLDKIFPNIEKCKCGNASTLLEEGNEIPYIGAKKSDNGVMRYVQYNEKLISKGNCIVFIGDGEGSVGYCLYQPEDFIGSTTLSVGYNEHLNKYNATFLVSIIDKERFRYSYGRKFQGSKIKETEILIPVTNEDEPDWQYMENFVKNKIIQLLPNFSKNVWNKNYDIKPCAPKCIEFDTTNWKDFRIDKIFYVELTKGDIKADDAFDGDIPLISSGERNNGIVKYIDDEGDGKAEIFEGNTLTVDMFCHAFYQPNRYYAVGHGRVNILKPKYPFNKYIGLFIASIINKEIYRFSYGRAVYSGVISQLEIKLPSIVNAEGEDEPDFNFMEQYIKSLPYTLNI